ncbi:Pentatricopeptide repeat-containing protein mitochondrial [Spatholobus suberectus]|nr:Pentatricopeptide repeat-containing protein mitochondrial [Spatholobus suberectus]
MERIWKVSESKPQIDDCQAAVEAWGKLKKIEEAEAVFEMMSKKWKLSAKNYSVVLKIYANNKMLKKGEVEKADSVLQKAIQQNQVQPMFTTHMAILEKYAKRGDIHNSEKIFHRIRKAGYTSRISQFQVLIIHAYINAKVPAYGIKERMKADNLFPNKTLANQLALVDAFRKNAVSDLLD